MTTQLKLEVGKRYVDSDGVQDTIKRTASAGNTGTARAPTKPCRTRWNTSSKSRASTSRARGTKMGREIDCNAPAIPPQEGKRYVMRNGDVSPFLYANGGMFFSKDYSVSWFCDGSYLQATDARHPLDLIAEYVPPPRHCD